MSVACLCLPTLGEDLWPSAGNAFSPSETAGKGSEMTAFVTETVVGSCILRVSIFSLFHVDVENGYLLGPSRLSLKLGWQVVS